MENSGQRHKGHSKYLQNYGPGVFFMAIILHDIILCLGIVYHNNWHSDDRLQQLQLLQRPLSDHHNSYDVHFDEAYFPRYL